MASITDLHYEILSYIIFLLVQSPDGAADFARTLSVSRTFLQFVQDENVLKAVAFRDPRISNRYQLFQQINGLLNRCALVGNVVAQFLLAKTILMSITELLASERKTVGQKLGLDHGRTPTGDTQVGSFILHFMPNIALNAEYSSKRLPHYELVKLFLRLCSPQYLAEMGVHLNHYIDYFTGFGNPKNIVMHQSVNQMCSVANQIMTLKEVKEIREQLDVFVGLINERRREARERGESSSAQEGRYELLAKIIMKCGTGAMVSEYRSWENGAGLDGILGANSDAVVFERYLGEVIERFEECRINAFSAFTGYFP